MPNYQAIPAGGSSVKGWQYAHRTVVQRPFLLQLD
jgi:hypothetical protein